MTSEAAAREDVWSMMAGMRSILAVVCLIAPALAAAQAPAPQPSAERKLAEGAFNGNLEIVRQLVSEGVAVDAVDPDKRTPLMWAAFNGHTAVVAHLLEHGAELEAKDANGRTALMYASSGPFAGTVELLIKKGAAVNVQGTLEGFTPLMTAAAEGEAKVVRLLLAHGADPTLKDVDGDTAASFARQKGHTSVVQLLENPPPAARKD